MAYKIVIDAGHGGNEPGAIYNNRREKDDTLRLALAVGDNLEKKGVEVIYTRTTDIYQTPLQKATVANQAGADFFVSLHRNSSPRPNTYSGVQTLLYDKTGQKLQMAENINDELEKAGYRNLGIEERKDLVVLRRTQMPAVLVEVGFINTIADNQLFEAKFGEIANGIAEGIYMTLQPVDEEDPVYYRVQTGLFKVRSNADNLLYQLQGQGFPAFIIAEDGYYKVQVGAFGLLDNAIKMEASLREAGYNTYITT